MRFLTGGESHGPALAVIIDGLPAGLAISGEDIDRDLARRQSGYGRGERMRIESDRARILSGVRLGFTTGAPITVLIENRDHENWSETMAVEAPRGERPPPETEPRPGHGDLAGMLKTGSGDARDVLERASARETASRTAAGAVAKLLLGEVGITVASRVIRIGSVSAEPGESLSPDMFDGVDQDPVRCADPEASRLMTAEIDRASEEGDSLGGVFEVAAFGVVPGLGSPAQYDLRLDGRLCGALASIPGIKGVEVGAGFSLAAMRGSSAHDEIFHGSSGLYRGTNRAGGLEAGMTNGEPLVLRAAMKPIPSLARPLATVNLDTLEPARAFKERADVCAVPAAAVVGEAVVALVLADAVTEKFGGDSMEELQHNLAGYLERISGLWERGG
ncbi:MAG: chorismate synthase [Actinobacteria bacterium]|nr:chorismate synthase [Actinomycetota bacterium]